MEQTPKPIFYDERGRRWPAVLRTWAVIGLVISVLGGIFFASVLFAPSVRIPLPKGLRPDDFHHAMVPDRDAAARAFLRSRIRSALDKQVHANQVMPVRARGRDRKPLSIVAGFYVNWKDTSWVSLTHHADALTHLIPEWMHLNADGQSFSTEETKKVLDFCLSHKLPIIPLINNVENRGWDGGRVHTLLASPAKQRVFIAAVLAYLDGINAQYHAPGFVLVRGINVDFETLEPADRLLLTRFIQNLAAGLHARNYILTQDVEVENDVYDLEALGEANDSIIPMLYDENDDTGGAGPIAGQQWFEDRAQDVYDKVPPEKVILGIGCYGYDWPKNKPGGTDMDYDESVIAARDDNQRIKFDPDSLNPHFEYTNDNGQKRDVWFLDGTTAYNEIRSQQPYKPLGAALWLLGSEDPTMWTFFDRDKLDRPADFHALQEISFAEEVDFTGRGEILSVRSTPQPGRRTITADKSGTVIDEQYTAYPSPFVIQQSGGQDPKTLALTFDDGPDPVWTPKILDILQRYHVPATFFVLGVHAEAYPQIIKREYGEGHELGNHSYYHPDFSQIGKLREVLELSATQRAIETLTGHSTHLFRAPYTVDTTPETQSQIQPLITAEGLGYVTVGANVDPNDWAQPGVNAILHSNGISYVKTIVPDVTQIDGVMPTIARGLIPSNDATNIILLHDAGGDRSQTVAALPRIITALRKKGYKFATISGLMGSRTRDEMMPPISGSQTLLVGADKVWFNLVYGTANLLQWLFYAALVLGVARVLFAATFALLEASRSRKRRFDPLYRPSVSVIIAAFNEERVIEKTVSTLLDSDYQDVEIIVVDDGSVDGTAAIVRGAFRDEPRVRLLQKPNGGKASALNRGLEVACGEIVIGLDADTMFAPDTIRLMVRHFHNPEIAAVAGNVKVGNRINLWTLWQSLEYITSQNFDRRAYSTLNCVTVVPGAVGAWRRTVIEEVGGYSADTLAEDTDLTLRVRRRGYRITTENAAAAYTEAPDNVKALAKQRFRWAFGTLQCLWKHRDALLRREYGTLGTVALPTLWLFQIVFQAISPVVDLMIIWTAWHGINDILATSGPVTLAAVMNSGLGTVLFYYALFFAVDMFGAVIAVLLDREDWRLLLWMFLQRFVYRQVMYYVIGRSVIAAIRGGRVGWGKLARKGTATMAESVR